MTHDHARDASGTASDDEGPSDLLVTASGGARLHAAAFKRTTPLVGDWARPTTTRSPAHRCLPVARSGVPISIVQAWLGHSSLQTTQIYVHYLGDFADKAGLES